MSRADLSEVRKRAWETRRARYGNRGHRGAYLTGRNCPRCVSMEGVLSEEQAVKATGLDRVEVRRLADERLAEMSDVKQHKGGPA